MSKQPVTPQAGGGDGEPSMGARRADAAPPHPGTGHIRFATVHSDGAGDTARPQVRMATYTPVRRQEPAADEQARVYGQYRRGDGREEPPAPKRTWRWGRGAGQGGAAPPQAASPQQREGRCHRGAASPAPEQLHRRPVTSSPTRREEHRHRNYPGGVA
jgi:hypothetical protein